MNLTNRSILSLFCFLHLACGAKTNIVGLTVPDSHKYSFFHNIDMAQALYDQGKHKEARIYAKRAFAQDPDSEDASVILGFIDLSLAGGDPFQLAKALIAADNAKKESSTSGDPSTTEPDPAEPEPDAAGEEQPVSTTDTLGSVKTAIGITQAEIESLGTKDETDPQYPLLIPKCVEDLRSVVERLNYINEAIRAICPFVDADIRNDADYRQHCDSTSRQRTFRAKSHFLWSFAHLTEAIAFNSVLTYSNAESTDKRSNLEKRVEKIQKSDTNSPDGIEALLESLKSIEATVNAVFPAGGVCSETAPTSQLRATLNDMLAVDNGFSRIAGMPDNIVRSIRKAVAKINGSGTGGIGSKLATIKSDFTKKISGGLSAKVDLIFSDPSNPLPADQKDQICSLLGSISSGTEDSSACD